MANGGELGEDGGEVVGGELVVAAFCIPALRCSETGCVAEGGCRGLQYKHIAANLLGL